MREGRSAQGAASGYGETQQADIFNPRCHAERLIHIPPHYKPIYKIRLRVATDQVTLLGKQQRAKV